MTVAPRQWAVHDLFPRGIAEVVTCEKVEQRLGYAPGRAHEVIRAGIDAHRARLDDIGRDARAAVSVFPVKNIDALHGAVRLVTAEFACGARIASQLSGAVELAIFLATTGAAFQDALDTAIRGHDPFEHFLLDAVGSVFAESCAAAVHDAVRDGAGSRVYGASNRYSPGYCGWSVADQRILFALLGGAHCGVRLSSSAMMHPIKSVSGVIGLGPGMVCLPHGCADCDTFDCMYRVASVHTEDEAGRGGVRA